MIILESKALKYIFKFQEDFKMMLNKIKTVDRVWSELEVE